MTPIDRKAFETWINSPPYEYGIERHPKEAAYQGWAGQYKEYETELAWEAWEEALKQERKAPADPVADAVQLSYKNVSKMTVEELHHDGYVCVVFQPGDVKSLRESWSEDKCIEQLAANAKYANDLLIELGWDVLDTLLDREPRWSMDGPLCIECGNFFDDNGDKPICKTCEDWVVVDGVPPEVKQMPCNGCGIPIPMPPEDADWEERLCDACLPKEGEVADATIAGRLLG